MATLLYGIERRNLFIFFLFAKKLKKMKYLNEKLKKDGTF